MPRTPNDLPLPAQPLASVGVVAQPPPLERPPSVAEVAALEAGGSTLPALTNAQLDAIEAGLYGLHRDVGILGASLRTGDRVDDRSTVTLSATPGSSDQLRGNPVDLFWSAAAGPVQSLAVANANPFGVFVGLGPGSGTVLGAAWWVPPYTLLVVPVNTDVVSIGADATAVGGDSTVIVQRSTLPIDHPAAYPLGPAVAVPLAQTTTPLTTFAAYVSGSLPALPYFTRVAGGVYTDQPGTVNLQAQVTPGGQWRLVQSWPVAANTYTVVDAPASGATHRMTYANGANAQGFFELSTYLRRA